MPRRSDRPIASTPRRRCTSSTVSDGPLVDRDDEVAVAKTGARGRRTRLDARDLDRALVGEPERANQAAIERTRLPAEAQIGSHHPTVREKLWNHRGGRVDRHGEADALGHREHRSVDADHPAAGVDQRPAGVAGIERDVRLDDAVDEPTRRAPERSSGGADHAGRHGRLELERIADGDDELAHPQPGRLPQAHCRQRRRVDLDERQIRARILAHERRGEPASIGERDLEPGCLVHDVTVRSARTHRRR